MAAATTDPQLDLVTCSLCYELFNNTDRAPKGLPCMHTFCLQCLDTYIKKNKGAKLRCPLCQAEFSVPPEGAHAVPTNILAKQLMDTLKIGTNDTQIARCSTCQAHRKGQCEFMCMEQMEEAVKQIAVNLDDGDIETSRTSMAELKKKLEECRVGNPQAHNIKLRSLSDKYVLDMGEFHYSLASSIGK